MAQILQHRRNTTAGLSTELGSPGEIFIDTSKNTVVVMDGATSGGHALAKESDVPTKVSDLPNDAGYITTASVFSGSYNDLTDVPTLFSGAYADLTGKPTLFSGSYTDLTDKPVLFDGQYSSLSGIPSTFAPSAHSQPFSTITNKPTTLSGYGITDAAPLFDQNLYTANNVIFSEVRADFYGNVWSVDNTTLLLDGNNKAATLVNLNVGAMGLGNTHSITAVDDYTMQFGPNDAKIYFGTPLQNWYQVQNVDQILLTAESAVSVTLPDESQWTFGLGGGIDFPDGSTQTTAYPGPPNLASLPYTDGTSFAWAGTAPTTIGEAIDRLATALASLQGQPIS